MGTAEQRALHCTWCSLRLILTAGATTFCRRSRSAKTHSSFVAMRKSPLNRVLKPYRNDSRLGGERFVGKRRDKTDTES